MKYPLRTTALCGALALVLTPAGFAQGAGQPPAPAHTQETQIDSTTAKIDKESQEHIIKDAVKALQSTSTALAALQRKDGDAALDALADATGKLELVISADPDLALAPIDVHETVYDLYTDPKAVDAVRTRAISLLRAGHLQDARALLKDMASELVIETVSIPLVTYPDAIKAVVPLVQAGKYDDAVTGLQAALNTLVVVDTVVPLPILRSETAVGAARLIASKGDKLTSEQKAEVDKQLDFARSQLRLAVALGYADRGSLKELHSAIENVRKMVRSDVDSKETFKNIINKIKEKADTAKKDLNKKHKK